MESWVALGNTVSRCFGLTTSLTRDSGRIVLSHIVEIRTEVRDDNGVRAACVRLRLERPIDGKT